MGWIKEEFVTTCAPRQHGTSKGDLIVQLTQGPRFVLRGQEPLQPAHPPRRPEILATPPDIDDKPERPVRRRSSARREAFPKESEPSTTTTRTRSSAVWWTSLSCSRLPTDGLVPLSSLAWPSTRVSMSPPWSPASRKPGGHFASLHASRARPSRWEPTRSCRWSVPASSGKARLARRQGACRPSKRRRPDYALHDVQACSVAIADWPGVSGRMQVVGGLVAASRRGAFWHPSLNLASLFRLKLTHLSS
jgi:hypothetical protein